MIIQREMITKLDKSKYYLFIRVGKIRVIKYEHSRKKWCASTGVNKYFFGIDIFNELSFISAFMRSPNAELIILDSEQELDRYILGLELLK